MAQSFYIKKQGESKYYMQSYEPLIPSGIKNRDIRGTCFWTDERKKSKQFDSEESAEYYLKHNQDISEGQKCEIVS